MPESAADPDDRLAALLAAWSEKYAHPIVELALDSTENSIRGHVLTSKQLADVQRAFAGTDVEVDVVLLTDPSVEPVGWLAFHGGAGSLFQGPDRARLSTEVDAGDGALRWMGTDGAARLVQVGDGTVGWVEAAEVRVIQAPGHWPKRPILPSGGTLTAPMGLPALEVELQSWLGVPYVLGGRSRSRIDCSGLVSLVLRELARVAVPRHSTDQMKCGLRVARGQMGPGDLVFARMRKGRVSHVGWLLAGEGGLDVVHASQRAGHVVRESLDEFEVGYRFMGARRLGPEETR